MFLFVDSSLPQYQVDGAMQTLTNSKRTPDELMFATHMNTVLCRFVAAARRLYAGLNAVDVTTFVELGLTYENIAPVDVTLDELVARVRAGTWNESLETARLSVCCLWWEWR